MKYFKLSEKIQDVRRISEIGNSDVVRCGLCSLNDTVGFKKGYPVFIGGAPHSGKTEIGLEWLLNLSITKGWKHFCYLGEGGSPEECFNELLHKYLGKSYKNSDEKDRKRAEGFIGDHFIIANDDLDFMIGGFYEAVTECETDLGIKFDTTFFDPFNDIEEELMKFANREDKFLAYALKQVRVSSKKNKRVDFVVTHISDIKAIQDPKSKEFYMRPALPNEWAGGRTWWRRAFLMVLIYRPPVFMVDENGVPPEENETWVYTQKAKPKGIARLGKRSVFFDRDKNKYYAKNKNGQQLYSCQSIEDITYKPLFPNQGFAIEAEELK